VVGILSGAQTDELIRLLVDAYPTRFEFAIMFRTQHQINLDAFALTGAGATDYSKGIDFGGNLLFHTVITCKWWKIIPAPGPNTSRLWQSLKRY
jgi:hypothetical protein